MDLREIQRQAELAGKNTAQNSRAEGELPQGAPEIGSQGTQSGPALDPNRGMRSLGDIMEFGRGRELHLTERESSNVIDQRREVRPSGYISIGAPPRMQNLIPGLTYEEHQDPQEMMMAGLKEIVEMSLSKDANVLKEAAAEAEKHRQETEKKVKERNSKPDRGFNETKRDAKLNELDQQEARVLAQGTQLIYDLQTRNIERRYEAEDKSHTEYSKKHFPGAKKMLFFTDRDGVVRAAWNQQLTMEEGNELERQEISELLKNAQSDEDKAYYTDLLSVLDKEKAAGRTPADKAYDAGFIGRLIGNTRSVRTPTDDAASTIMANEAKETIQSNVERAPLIRAAIESKYGKLIAEEARNRKDQEEFEENQRKKKAAEAAKKKKKTKAQP